MKIDKIPGHYYSTDEIKFLKDNCWGRTTQELTELFNKEFKTKLTTSQIYSKKKALKLKSGVVTRFKKSAPSYSRGVGYQHYFTKEQVKFLQDNVDLPNYLLTEKFNLKFNTSLSIRKIISAKHRRCIKGIVPYGSRYLTGYKKGNIPALRKPIGTERMFNGYKQVKVQDGKLNANWSFRHRVEFEKAHGKILPGHKVIFADGNRLNVDLDNLISVKCSELAIINKMGLYYKNKELTKTGVLIAKVICRVGEINNKKKMEVNKL